MDGHMTEDDPWILNNSRMEIEREIVRRIGSMSEVVQWFELLGLERELEPREISSRQIISADQVHLSDSVCKRAAVNLCYRVAEELAVLVEEGRPSKMTRC